MEVWKARFLEFRRRHPVSQTQYIAYGFFILIMAGTLLLMLPAASRSGESIGFIDALFTSASASCVTGLIVADTWSQWTLFGQLVIITLIQIGGLGFITLGVLIAIILRRKIGLKQRGRIQESTSALKISGVVRLVKKILLGTLLFEGVGAVLLSIRFIPDFGVAKGIYYGVFHAISAFCNAGFDLMGAAEPYSSLVGRRHRFYRLGRYQPSWTAFPKISASVQAGADHHGCAGVWRRSAVLSAGKGSSDCRYER